MLKSTSPRKVALPIKLSSNYAAVFTGKTTSDSGKLSQIDDILSFRPLWNTLEKKPNTPISGLPFKWKDNGVEYSSDCAVFERNMLMAAYAGKHFNDALDAPDSDTDVLKVHLIPTVTTLNYLLDKGVAEDGSRSINEDINPPSLRRANLLALRNAGIALGWSKSADSVIADADPSDLPASLSLASKWKLKSSQVGSEAGSYIPDGWCKSKKIDSVGLQAQKWMTLHEKDPTKAFCTRALKAYDATLSAIGYGLLVKSDLVKSDLMNNRRQCLEDLELIYGMKKSDVDKLAKERAPSLDHVLTLPDTQCGRVEDPKDFLWMTTPLVPGEASEVIELA